MAVRFAAVAWLAAFAAVADAIRVRNDPRMPGPGVSEHQPWVHWGMPHDDSFAMAHASEHYRFLYMCLVLFVPLSMTYGLHFLITKFDVLTLDELTDKMNNANAAGRKAAAHKAKKEAPL
jgi:hypothetical protein